MSDEKRTFGQRVAEEIIPSEKYLDKWIETVRAEYAAIIDRLYNERIKRLKEKCQNMADEYDKAEWGEYGDGGCHAARAIIAFLEKIEANNGK